jgi:hypothetical protein
MYTKRDRKVFHVAPGPILSSLRSAVATYGYLVRQRRRHRTNLLGLHCTMGRRQKVSPNSKKKKDKDAIFDFQEKDILLMCQLLSFRC